MNRRTIQDILPFAQQPSRYLGTEVNAVRKDPGRVALSIALAFPDLYEIGTSHFGLQILYHLLNGREEIAAERVFAPAADVEARLRAGGIPLTAMESGRPLAAFDILGFSLLYELNYTNVLTILELSGIPFFSRDRGEGHPLVIAGGPCTCNPEPVADLFDAMVIGEGEATVPEMADAWLRWRRGPFRRHGDLLDRWAEIEGVYIPSRFPDPSGGGRVRRALVPDLDGTPFPDRPVIPYGKPVHDRLRIEIARGCTRGCRFCQAGMIYRPVRERSPETVLDLTRRSLAATGYEDLSLLSLSSGDYGAIAPLMAALMGRCAGDRVAVSLPSLRAGTLTPELMALIKQVRKTGFTIAPEAGSQRLRDVINKNITEADIVETVREAFGMGWQGVKLYFMIGLPTETPDDLSAIVDLVETLKVGMGRKKGRRPRLNVSVGTFIPKPHTPFQWASQLSLSESRRRIRWLESRLGGREIRFKWQNPEVSLLEGLWARGDRRLSRLLVAAHRKGCRFDGWSDGFDFGRWTAALAETGIDIDEYTVRPRDLGDPLPWDHIDVRVDPDFLRAEWHRAVAGAPTGDCRTGDCNDCGVCDFRAVSPITHEAGAPGPAAEPVGEPPPKGFRKLTVTYARTGQAAYFGHLELVNIFCRALRRAAIPVKYSEGFHPLPKIAFDDPLPIGMESEGESFRVTASGTVTPDGLMADLNPQLPEGLRITGCCPAAEAARPDRDRASYRVTLGNGSAFDPDSVKRFHARASLPLSRTNPKGKSVTVDLKAAVTRLALPRPDRAELTLRAVDGKSVRPQAVLETIFDLSGDVLKQAQIVKLVSHPCTDRSSSM